MEIEEWVNSREQKKTRVASDFSRMKVDKCSFHAGEGAPHVPNTLFVLTFMQTTQHPIVDPMVQR